MKELTNWGVGLLASAMALSLLSLVVDEVGPAGFIASFAMIIGIGCVVAANWRDVLQAIANRKPSWKDRV